MCVSIYLLATMKSATYLIRTLAMVIGSLWSLKMLHSRVLESSAAHHALRSFLALQQPLDGQKRKYQLVLNNIMRSVHV